MKGQEKIKTITTAHIVAVQRQNTRELSQNDSTDSQSFVTFVATETSPETDSSTAICSQLL